MICVDKYISTPKNSSVYKHYNRRKNKSKLLLQKLRNEKSKFVFYLNLILPYLIFSYFIQAAASTIKEAGGASKSRAEELASNQLYVAEE